MQQHTTMNITRKDFIVLLMQLGFFAILIGLPLLMALFWGASVSFNLVLRITLRWMLPMMAVYLLNYYVLVPLLYYKHHRWLFVFANVLIIALINNFIFFGYKIGQSGMIISPTTIPEMGRPMYYSNAIVPVALHIFAAIAALGVRHLSRLHEVELKIKEQEQKTTQAELAWLKNQLNPHFLFNTLNNISSLTQIDADQAQESIAQLSDLLRYAMYETEKPLVPLTGEVEFMKNYIDLMRLRCGKKTTVKVDMQSQQGAMVAPLLFISLIENAFKHGVSSNQKSNIDICLTADDGLLTFICDNTNYPKDNADRSGSGIGLENTRRRLQLLYPDRHTWEQTLVDDIYHIKITIQL